MTNPNGMPDNPGDPENTDPDATSADRAEQAADESAARQAEDPEAGQAAEADSEIDPNLDAVIDPNLDAAVDADLEADLDAAIDPDLEAEIDAALAGVDPNADGDGEVSDVEQQLAERTEDLQRVSAEYANYRRRTERDREGIIDNAKANVISQLLPVLDDLDLAEQHGDLKDGPMRALSDKLINTFTNLKVESFGVIGDEFDPEIHEAVQDLSQGDTKVLGTVLRKGYRLNNKLIRNAMVIIADPEQ